MPTLVDIDCTKPSKTRPILAACFTCAFTLPDGNVSPEYLTAARACYHVAQGHDVRPAGNGIHLERDTWEDRIAGI